MSLRRTRPRPWQIRVGVLAALAVVGSLAAATPSAAAAAAARSAPRDTRFYVPPPDPGAIRQIKDLARGGDLRDAVGIARMVTTPQAVWFTSGTPAEVRRSVHHTVEAAARQHAVPVLVAYNLPFRDCAQYSAGGATDTNAYLAWIRGFAAGIGRRPGDRDPRARQPGDHPQQHRHQRHQGVVPAEIRPRRPRRSGTGR